MSESSNKAYASVGISGPGFGVFWWVWGKYGFWWGVWYGINWLPWVGYHIARHLMP